ncbi:pantothenate kinase [Methanobrevibacter arboriphilus JCM 13429 = DSM 1125]|uniref:Pantoate kinase n=1 Tax=Methanobrevibacter arboriphilus JCM 13429 = DSM 1125 TaxID=1300164 RepID=A0A1V6N383_METAZ|nr:pantoate kinase [Methanobrevibacter arboriphilus]OQD58956.1 pantothenate kinase [Methanobrevibacter arboriphilus JCM 13429 = DSM 1125]
MKVSIFVPSNITGFFSIKEDENPLKKGSCGAGVLIDSGVKTIIQTLKKGDDENHQIQIRINGKKDPKNELITLKTIEILKPHIIKNSGKFELKDDLLINHEINVPVGSGFGTSASCSFGTAIGLSKIFNLNLSNNQAGQIAHLTEVELGSGLGDVLSQTSKGIMIRTSPGAPGIGKTNIIRDKNNFSDVLILTKTFGEIDTSSIIEDPKMKKNINKFGLIMQERIINNPTIENFMDCSYEFAKKTGLMNKELLKIVNELKKCTIGASMAMLGNTVFAIANKEDLGKIQKSDNLKAIDFKISKIYNDNIKID